MTVAFAIGWMFAYSNKNCPKEIGKREGFIIVGVVWIVFAFFGSLPFVFSGYVSSITDAFFETMSGFTTTGSTIIRDIEGLPHGLLFWRAFMHFTGGIGILVLCIAVLPIFGVGSMNIYQAETSTVSIGEKFSPRIKDVAKHIFRIYLILTASCILFYLPAMDFFDAVCHAFSTTAIGGFSTKNASMGAFSVYAQYVTILFMILGSCPFVLFFYAWKCEFGKITKNDEFRFYLTMILIISLFICIVLLIKNQGIVEPAIREGIFNVVSMISTTGYVINDYMQWSPPMWFIIFLTAFIGGCAGSTSGGLKMVRFLLLVRMIPMQFKKIMHQNAIVQVKLNGQTVPEDKMYRILAFFIIFLFVYIAGVFILILCGLNFTTAAGTSIACLSNTGSGLDLSGPHNNFANLSVAAKWICSFLMLFGRLEVYSILILFSPAFWRKQ
jgi:trk system potassium uptake protein TrkH